VLIDEVLLRAVAAELSSALDGARVEKVYQPLSDLVLVEVFPSPGRRRLALSCDRTYGFLGLVDAKLPNPLEPPPFCMLLRKWLTGARCCDVEARSSDRVVALHFHRSRAGSDDETSVLELRLRGDRPNLLLFDGEGRPRGKLLNYSHHHGTLADDPDLAPLERPDNAADHPLPDVDELTRLLGRTPSPRDVTDAVPSLPPRLATLLHAPAAPPDVLALRAAWIRRVLDGSEPVAPVVLTWPLEGRSMVLPHAPPPGLEPTVRVEPAGPLVDAVQRSFFDRGHRSRTDAARRSLERVITRNRKKLTRKRCALRDGLQATDKADAIFHQGELLKTVLHTVPPRATAVTVFDWATNRQTELPLDPTLTAKQNLERIFARAKKAKRSHPILVQQAEDVDDELHVLAILEERLLAAREEPEFDEISTILTNMGLLDRPNDAGRRKCARSRDRMLRTYTSSDGMKIFVGRNSVENEYLSRHVARHTSLWFHARDAAGAHVVVRLARGQTCPKATVQEAAQLAVHFSKRRYDTHVQVVRARGSEVRRPSGAPPGTVQLRQFDVLPVRPDPAVVRRLLGHEALTTETRRTDEP